MKTYTYRTLLSFALILAFSISANAQFSLMLGGSYLRQAPKVERNPILGIDGKFAVDFGKKYQLGFSAAHYKSVRWAYKQDLDIMNKQFSFHHPVKTSEPEELTVNRFSLLFSYFFLGENASTAGMYASAGPSLMRYTADKQVEQPGDVHIAETASSYHLDTRLGGQVNIGIGWLYAEGVFSPMVARSASSTYDLATKPYYGLNLGIRFLLNKHPQCE